MPNFQKICVFDLETDGTNPDKCSPVQIAAIMVDPRKLEIVPDSEFNVKSASALQLDNPNKTVALCN
jgi:DNA polymerase III epsilon subunit-like protein